MTCSFQATRLLHYNHVEAIFLCLRRCSVLWILTKTICRTYLPSFALEDFCDCAILYNASEDTNRLKAKYRRAQVDGQEPPNTHDKMGS